MNNRPVEVSPVSVTCENCASAVVMALKYDDISLRLIFSAATGMAKMRQRAVMSLMSQS
jgi:hypothetical protein